MLKCSLVGLYGSKWLSGCLSNGLSYDGVVMQYYKCVAYL
jgi:hypothetical protein